MLASRLPRDALQKLPLQLVLLLSANLCNMGACGSSSAAIEPEATVVVASDAKSISKLEVEEEKPKETADPALAELEQIVAGNSCLSREEHSWMEHSGQRGMGRACGRCFMVQDTKCRVVWKLQPQCDIAEPSASDILELWRTELARVRAGGCIAGAEHSWVDVQQTGIRMTAEARCCEKCGLVQAGKEGDGGPLILPNLVGIYGIPTTATYRGQDHPTRAGVV